MIINRKTFNLSWNLVLFLSMIGFTSTVLAHKNGDGKVREYWITAEYQEWDFIPSGTNKIKPADGIGEWGAIHKYDKARFIQYSDGFRAIVPQPESRGILGPEIRAVVGDTVIVHFKNLTNEDRSMHPHGLRYTPENDGSDYALTGKPGSKVGPGEEYTYEWVVDKKSGPAKNDPSSIMWVYHSHVDSVRDIYDGLIGTIVVIRKGMAKETSHGPVPKDVDKEFTTMFMVFNEEDGEEGGLMHSMNGYMFGNLEGYVVDKGDDVRWYIFSMGTEVDLHTAHWHGETVELSGTRTDVVELLPTAMKTVDMSADNPGTWLYHCHVTDHIVAGMMARWTVNP